MQLPLFQILLITVTKNIVPMPYGTKHAEVLGTNVARIFKVTTLRASFLLLWIAIPYTEKQTALKKPSAGSECLNADFTLLYFITLNCI